MFLSLNHHHSWGSDYYKSEPPALVQVFFRLNLDQGGGGGAESPNENVELLLKERKEDDGEADNRCSLLCLNGKLWDTDRSH